MSFFEFQVLGENECFEIFFGALLKQKTDVGSKRFVFAKRYTGELKIIFCF
jgi:hypothetical protein